jgi:ankyrin repeat protein
MTLEKNSMKFLKVVLAAMVLSFSFNAMAARTLTDDEYMEFTSAVGDGNLPTIKKYIEDGLSVDTSFLGWSPILMAAAKGQFELVKYFTSKGADVNFVHQLTKWTPFMHAAYDGNQEMAKYLADHGADINKKMRGDVDIIRVVRDTGNTKMVDFLLSLGVKNDGCQSEKCL